MLTGCMCEKYSLLLGEHRLGRDATVLAEVVSLPVGDDVHFWLIGLHSSSRQRLSGCQVLGYLRPREHSCRYWCQWLCDRLWLSSSCVLLNFIFSSASAFRRGGSLSELISHLSKMHLRSFTLSARTWAARVQRDWRNWKWWQTEIKHIQVCTAKGQGLSELSFCCRLSAAAAAHFCWHSII